jgi:hypothetical protein
VALSAGRATCKLEFGDVPVQKDEIIRLENYLKKLFQLPTIEVRQRPQKDDSVEVYIGDEFIGIIFRDDEDEDLSYQFQMAILEFDLQ